MREAGRVKTLKGQVSVERGAKTNTLHVGDVLFESDSLVTADDASVGITLTDDTLITVGPASRLQLNTVAFNTTTNDGQLMLRLANGMMRIVTGLIAKANPANVRIETPTAVMGVRGTDFIVSTQDRP